MGPVDESPNSPWPFSTAYYFPSTRAAAPLAFTACHRYLTSHFAPQTADRSPFIGVAQATDGIAITVAVAEAVSPTEDTVWQSSAIFWVFCRYCRSSNQRRHATR